MIGLRLNKRIERIYGSTKGLFITLTFNDDSLNQMSYDERRNYIKAYLTKYFYEYVANLDYGGMKGREHYHAVGIPKQKLNHLDYELGAINFIRLYDNSKKLSQYIAKLTNHGIKKTVKSKLIYSRIKDKCPVKYSIEEINQILKIK